MQKEWSSKLAEYKSATNWSKKDSSWARPGVFIEPDGKSQPEEDLANNIEYYLFEPNKLQKISPAIFNWIKNKLGRELKISKGCDENKN